MTTPTYRPFFYGHEWIGEFVSADLREIAERLRSTADFLDGKAGLLEKQMALAASADTRPEGGDAQQAPFTSGAVPEGQTPKPSSQSHTERKRA